MARSLSDQLLAGGCVAHIGTVHGEDVLILSGPDAGRSFRANIVEAGQDMILETELGADPRGKRILRFAEGSPVPRIQSQGQVQTADGKKWNAVRQDFSGYLTVDFDLKEIVPGKDS